MLRREPPYGSYILFDNDGHPIDETHRNLGISVNRVVVYYHGEAR